MIRHIKEWLIKCEMLKNQEYFHITTWNRMGVYAMQSTRKKPVFVERKKIALQHFNMKSSTSTFAAYKRSPQIMRKISVSLRSAGEISIEKPSILKRFLYFDVCIQIIIGTLTRNEFPDFTTNRLHCTHTHPIHSSENSISHTITWAVVHVSWATVVKCQW